MKKSSSNLRDIVELIVVDNFDAINNVVDAVARKHFSESLGFDSLDKFKDELLDKVDISIETIAWWLDKLPENQRAIMLNNLDDIIETTIGGFLDKYVEVNNYENMINQKGESNKNEETFMISGHELSHVLLKNRKVRVVIHAKNNVVKKFVNDTGLILHRSPFNELEYEVEFDIEGQS